MGGISRKKEKNSVPFGGISLILVGDIGQLPPVQDKPLYIGNTAGRVLWKDIRNVSTLDTIFCQRGTDPNQVNFKRLLTNIINANPTVDDWNILMSRTYANMDSIEINTFKSKIYLFPTNTLVNVHNRCMIKSLGIPIARYITEHTKNTDFNDANVEQLQ